MKSGELAVSGDQWPIFLYASYAFDEEDPWNGLLRSSLLVSARPINLFSVRMLTCRSSGIQTRFYVP